MVAASWTIGSEEDARPRCTDSLAMSWADLKPARTARRARAGRALLSAEPGDGARQRRRRRRSCWLSFKEVEIRSGDWIDPDASRILFGGYAKQWIHDRVLKVRTEELYRGLLRNHLLSVFGNVRMGDIDEAAVRRWRKERLQAGPTAARPFGPVVVAKAYRLLHAIFTTAVDDRLVRRNLCRVEGGGREESPERETLSLPVVFEIADAIPVRYRVLVLLATFAGLRWGELIALRRDSIDLEACEIRVVETTAQLDTGTLLPETPKSRAGRRTVAFPAELVPEIRWHLERRRAGGARAALRRSSGRAAPAVQLRPDMGQGLHEGQCARRALS